MTLEFLTDKNFNHTSSQYLQKDKGIGRYVTAPYKAVPPMPIGMSKLSQFQNFVPAMERAGWSASKIEKVLGINWYLFFKKIWK